MSIKSLLRKTGNVAKGAVHVAQTGARMVTNSPIGSVAEIGLGFVPGGNLITAGLEAASGNYGMAGLSLVPGLGSAGKIGKIATVGAKMGFGSVALKTAGKLAVKYGPKAAAAAGIGWGVKTVAGNVFGGGSPEVGSLPPLPMSMGGGLPMGHPGSTAPVPGLHVPFVPRGPGGKMQLPWNDASTPDFLKNFALDDSYLSVRYRAPKGYVVLRDADGQPYPVLKWAAVKYGLWKPHRKPPVSAGDWHSLQRAHKTIKKMHKVYSRTAYVERNLHGGKVKVKHHKKKG